MPTLFTETGLAHLASTLPDGTPLLRTLHPVVVGDGVWFHGRATGEKARCVGRPAVVSTERVLARLPSTVFDPERACPATTWFESAEVHGALEVATGDTKYTVLAAMMAAYQPEGGYAPLVPGDARYAKTVDKLLIFGVRGPVRRRTKAGQGKPEAALRAVAEHLWTTGQVDTLHRLAEAFPERPKPAALVTELPVTLDPAPRDVPLPLLRDLYWNVGIPDERLVAAHRNASAWIVAHDAAGRAVATARAVADGVKYAWVYDVAVDEAWRGRGLGTVVMRALLDHAAVRDCARVLLATRDAMVFYRRLGFVSREEARRRPYPSTEMVLERSRPIGPLATG